MNWYIASIPLGKIPPKLRYCIGVIALKLLYRKVYPKGGPEIIHAHFAGYGYMASIISRQKGIPLVITEHSSKMNRLSIDSQKKGIVTEGYKNASAVISVSSGLAKNILENTGVSSTVIPNLLRLDSFIGCKRVPHNGFKIVTTSNLIPIKRPSWLITAVAANKYDDVSLEIIGDGPLRSELEIQVRDQKLGNRVKFHGYKNSRDISRIYETCDCFALVSESETFGVVIIEALAAGLPVISTKCGGPEDIINSSNGLLVDVNDLSKLIEAIEYMYNNRKKYQEGLLKAFVKDNYSPSRIANRITEVYRQTLMD